MIKRKYPKYVFLSFTLKANYSYESSTATGYRKYTLPTSVSCVQTDVALL